MSWNLKFSPKFFSIRKRDIIFIYENFSNSLLTNERCRQIILDRMYTFFKPPLSKLFIRIFCLILGLLWFRINSLWISFSWVIAELDKTVIGARYIIWEINNVVIVIFPSRVKFLILNIFRTFSIFCIWFWNSFNFFRCKNNELR